MLLFGAVSSYHDATEIQYMILKSEYKKII